MGGRKSNPDFHTKCDVVNCYTIQSVQVQFNLYMFKFAIYKSNFIQKIACVAPPSETSQSKHLMPGGDSWLVPFPGIR